jgi:acetyl esterase/lipase
MKRIAMIAATITLSFTTIWITAMAHQTTKTLILDKNEENKVELLPNITYVKVENVSLKMHLLIPKKHDNHLPLIIFIKGSAWGKNHPQNTYSYIPQLVPFAKHGYVVASIEHRTSHQAKFPAQLYDVKAAVRYLKSNAGKYHIDPKRVGVWGTSSGGHLAALLGTTGGLRLLEGKEGNLNQSSTVQAVVDWYGPTDFLQMSKFPSKVDFNAPDSPESMLIGGPLKENKQKVRLANPITYVTPDDPPFLIMHGDKDMQVPYNQSELLYEALKKSGVEADLYKIKGSGHGDGFSHHKILQIVQTFFDSHLMKN